MQNNIKKGIAGVALATALAGGGGVAIDRAIVTDKELHNSVNLAITQGKVPQIDGTKVTLDRVATTYMVIANEYGVDLTPTKTPENLYDKIREQKKGRGENINAKSNDVLPVR